MCCLVVCLVLQLSLRYFLWVTDPFFHSCRTLLLSYSVVCFPGGLPARHSSFRTCILHVGHAFDPYLYLEVILVLPEDS